MNRRDFIKGVIATGAIALSPIKPKLPPEAALPYVGRFQNFIVRGRITVPVITSIFPKGVIPPITDIVGYSPGLGRFITRQEFEAESVRLTTR